MIIRSLPAMSWLVLAVAACSGGADDVAAPTPVAAAAAGGGGSAGQATHEVSQTSGGAGSGPAGASAGGTNGGQAGSGIDAPAQAGASGSGVAGGAGAAAGGAAAGGSGAAVDYRIAYSSDGNQHDYDDLHASPFGLALLFRAGQKQRLVHWDYSNHLGDNHVAQAAQQAKNIKAAIQLFGYEPTLFFDDQVQLPEAIASMKAAIDASTEKNRLMLVCAGPMEVCWRGLQAGDVAKRQFVTVISHSDWNDTHSDTPQLVHTWRDIVRDFSALPHHINDQNIPAFKNSCANFSWLKATPQYGGALYDLVCTTPSAKAGDVSDAGMLWYVLNKGPITRAGNGTNQPSPQEVAAFFGQ